MLNKKCIGTRWRCGEGHEWVTAHYDHAWFSVPFKCPDCGKDAVAHRGEWVEETIPMLCSFAVVPDCCKPRQGGPVGVPNTRSLDDIMAFPTPQERWMLQQEQRRNRFMQMNTPVQKATPVKTGTPREVAKLCSQRLEGCSALLHKLLARLRS